MSSTIIFAGLLIVLGHAFKIMFDKTRVPDVIPMVITGLLVGPVFHLLTPENFGIMGELLTALALSIVLFHSGLEIDMSIVNKSLPAGARLAIVNFLWAVVLVACFTMVFFNQPFLEAISIGAILGGTSFAIVIPMANKMSIKDESKTILLLESTFSDVLCIVVSLGLFQMIKLREMHAGFIVGQIIASFLMSSLIGALAAFAWGFALKFVRRLENDILLTPAIIIIVFGLADFLGYSGAISSLAFGMVSGNIKKIIAQPVFSRFKEEDVMEFNKTELSIFSELVFILRIFFFFYVGLSIKISDIAIATLGFLMVAFIIGSRFISSKTMISSKNFSHMDRTAISIMAPRGLVSVVLLSLAVKVHFSNFDMIQELVYSAILFSVIISSVLSFALEKGKIDKISEKIFPQKIG